MRFNAQMELKKLNNILSIIMNGVMPHNQLIKILFIFIACFLVDKEAIALCYGDSEYPAHPSIKQEYELSKFVIIGIALSKQKISSSDDPLGYIATLYTIKPLRIFKGNPQSKFIIYSENTTARFPMNIGEEYIIFVQKPNDILIVYNCGHSGLVNDSAGVIEKVKALSKK
jgi:hypothetical protein